MEVMVRLIPLGALCKAAYQCRTQANELNLSKTVSTPFDWTVTPFRSLTLILNSINHPGVMPYELVLDPINCSINGAGSVRDEFTGISFHHDLDPELVETHLKIKSPKNVNRIPGSLAHSAQWSQARERFLHTLNNFKQIFAEPEVVFVRWQLEGVRRAYPRFPEIFSGESPFNILRSLQRAGMHDTSSLLTVTTKVLPNQHEEIESPVHQYIKKQNGQNAHAVLAERRGLNGDQTSNFRGDEASWNALFVKHLNEMKYDL